MLSKNDKMFDVLYESTLAAKGIQHLDCELLKEFAEALYNYGYTDGVCTTIDNEFPVIGYVKERNISFLNKIINGQMNIEVQKAMLDEIKEEIENLDRILNRDNDCVKDELIIGLYKFLCLSEFN